MRVVIAPDSFRGTVSAGEAAAAIASGVRETLPAADVVELPIADGGEGTLDCLLRVGFEPLTVRAHGPLGAEIAGRIAVRGGTAVAELAELCGWPRQDGPLRPLDASSRGLGDGVRAALDAGCRDIVLAVGGSVSTDGGLGVLAALGGRASDRDGGALDPSGRALLTVESIDLQGLDHRLASTRIRLATDVSNPLAGPRGAAHVFAPQKGATPAEVDLLDAGLQRLARVLESVTGVRVAEVPGAGAAGGVGAVAVAVLRAEIVSGADLVLDAVGFDALTADADLVVTGEGRWDGQSLSGKAAARVAARSTAPVALVAGRIDAPLDEVRAAGFVDSLTLVDLDPGAALTRTPQVLREAGRILAARRLP
jgi:glycerate kinase